jgi:hypothetical protein
MKVEFMPVLYFACFSPDGLNGSVDHFDGWIDVFHGSVDYFDGWIDVFHGPMKRRDRTMVYLNHWSI